jgi:hypothetical protein
MKKLLHDYLLQLSILALFIFLGMYTAVFYRGTSASTTTLPLSYEVKEVKWAEYEAKQRAALEEAFSPKNIESLKAQRTVELNARLAEEKSRMPFFINRVEDFTTGKITVEKVVKE